MPCVIAFGRTDTRGISVSLDLDADEVGKRLRENADGFERFEDRKGRPVWINVRNVLWVESRDPAKSYAA